MAVQSISTECFVMPETRGQSQKRDILDCDCMLQFAKVPCSGDGTMRKADCNFSFFPCNSTCSSLLNITKARSLLDQWTPRSGIPSFLSDFFLLKVVRIPYDLIYLYLPSKHS